MLFGFFKFCTSFLAAGFEKKTPCFCGVKAVFHIFHSPY